MTRSSSRAILAIVALAASLAATAASAHSRFPCRLGQIFRPSLGVCQGRPYRLAAATPKRAAPRRTPAPTVRIVVRTRIRVVTRTIVVHDPAPKASPGTTVAMALPAQLAAPPAPKLEAIAPGLPTPTARSASIPWAGVLNRHPALLRPTALEQTDAKP